MGTLAGYRLKIIKVLELRLTFEEITNLQNSDCDLVESSNAMLVYHRDYRICLRFLLVACKHPRSINSTFRGKM